MAAKPENLGEVVQRFGYTKQRKIKLYSKELELVSDPTNREGDDVFIDAREKGSEGSSAGAGSSKCGRNGKGP